MRRQRNRTQPRANHAKCPADQDQQLTPPGDSPWDNPPPALAPHIFNPPRETEHGPSPPARLDALRRALCPGNETLYAVLDTAIDDTLYPRLQEEPETSQARCLYDGDAAVRYARYAPYLLRLHADSPLTRHWMAHGWPAHWGFSAPPAARRMSSSAISSVFSASHIKAKPSGCAFTIRAYCPSSWPNCPTAHAQTFLARR